MKETLLYFAVGVIALVSGLLALHAGLLAPVPGLGMVLGVAAAMMTWVALRLQRVWKGLSSTERANNDILNQMRWLFTFSAIFLWLDLFPHVILVVAGFPEEVVSWAHWTAHLFLFTYTILAARMAVSFFNPRLKTPITIFIVLVSLSALVVSIMKPDYLVTIPGSAYPLVSSDPLYALFNMITNIASFGIFGWYLIAMGLFSSATSVTRIRALLMGIGLQGPLVMGYLIHYSHASYTPAAIYVCAIDWALFTGLAALYASRWRSN